MKRFQLLLILSATLAASQFTQTAQARPYVSFGLRFGPGYYYGPGPYYYGYGYPYYAPGPLVYEVAPRIVVRSAPEVGEPIPPAPAPYVPPAPSVAPSSPNVIPVVNATPGGTRLDSLMAQLSDANENIRRDAALDLGRMKAQKAVDPLMTLLSKDSSPVVRDGAARGLGLIASPRSLNALIFAAQADNDRDVRRSAQFAVEVIRTNLRGN